MSAYEVVTTKWLRITGPNVFCTEPTCPFYYHGDTDRTAHIAMNAARLHVEETGHLVIVQEGRSKWLKPRTSI